MSRGVSEERFALRAALRELAAETYRHHSLGRCGPPAASADNVVLAALRCMQTADGRSVLVVAADGPGPDVIEAGIRLRWLRPRYGWDFAEYGRDLDVFEILDGPLAGRLVDVAQPIGAFSAEQELAAWLLVEVDSTVALEADRRQEVLTTIATLFPGVLLAEQ